MKRLAVLGASGHGKVVADAALTEGWDDVIFFDDAWPDLAAVGPWPVVGDTAAMVARTVRYDGAVVAIGDNRTRMIKLRLLEAASVPLVPIVHAAAIVSRFARIGSASVVFAGAVVNPFASLGAGCIVNTCASVDHDCVLADGVHVSPGAHLGGGVTVGETTWIGIGASVRHNTIIGRRVMVGAGAVVVRQVDDDAVVLGVPARSKSC